MVLIGIPDIFDKLQFFNGKITDLLRFIHNPETNEKSLIQSTALLTSCISFRKIVVSSANWHSLNYCPIDVIPWKYPFLRWKANNWVANRKRNGENGQHCLIPLRISNLLDVPWANFTELVHPLVHPLYNVLTAFKKYLPNPKKSIVLNKKSCSIVSKALWKSTNNIRLLSDMYSLQSTMSKINLILLLMCRPWINPVCSSSIMSSNPCFNLLANICAKTFASLFKRLIGLQLSK